jgi:hypothetical protein
VKRSGFAFPLIVALTVVTHAPVAAQAVAPAAAALPAKLDDSTFWRLVTEYSEPGGFFRSDNFVSNETTFQYVIPGLQRRTRPGGVYLGVGPEQNFTYIVALQPKIAFIFDIRRQNMLTHLMYKAVIEQAADRADFLSRLFSRTRPASLDTASTVDALFAAYAFAPQDSVAFRKNLAAIKDRLTRTHGFKLSDEDLRTIEYVYNAFYLGGPDLTYNFAQGSGFRGGRMPSYADVMTATDEAGLKRSYLATEANFRALKRLETDNAIVPLVGDFAGPHAIRTVGKYLRERGATVTAFYTSNVEQYLFQSDEDWRRFFSNVATLPVDSSSVFIRSVFNGMGMIRYPATVGPRSETLVASIAEQVKAFTAGTLASYFEVIQTSRP